MDSGVPNLLVTVSGHHVDVTAAMKEYAQEKADKLARYFGAKEVVVTLKVERGRQIAEFIVYAPRRHTLIAEAEQQDMYAAIDLVADKMERQLTKLKEKWSDHHAKETRQAEQSVGQGPLVEEGLPEEEEE